MAIPRSWDIFCRVIDNFGDAAVCWRLARSLVGRRLGSVRLWIDHPAVLEALVPQIEAGRARQSLDGVEICHWVEDARFDEPADVALDAFGGGIPEAYAQAMAARTPRSIWIVLEYLSAEPWVPEHHGLPSPHPRLQIERYFFFPGFGPGTGGMLREPEFAARRENYLRHPALRDAFWQDMGYAPPGPDAILVSLFGYENAATGELLEAWASGGRSVIVAVPESWISTDVRTYLGITLRTGATLNGQIVGRDALEVRFLPFLSQDRYDELLWICDWNFVRGEDSFVRTQWAERPFVWHIYPQKDDAHLVKLEAFLDAYCSGLDPALAEPLRALWRGWNRSRTAPAGAIGGAWTWLSALSPAQGEALRLHAHRWAQGLTRSGDLAENLANFCANRLK